MNSGITFPRLPGGGVLVGLLILVPAAVVLPAAAGDGAVPVISDTIQRESIAVTAYSQGFALVSERRRVELPAGSLRLHWDGVARQLDPDSVVLADIAAPASLSLLEQFFDDDVVSPARLMELHVGREVTVVQEDRELREKRTAARLLSTAGPTLEIDGAVVVGHPGRLEFPELPDGLLLRPALGWLAESASAGSRLLEARYLTGGVDWRAVYRLDLNSAEDAAALEAWVSVENRSGATFEDVELQLVAGDVNRTAPPLRHEARAAMAARAGYADVAAEAAPAFGGETLSAYHLYTLERPATLADNRTSRLPFAAAAGVPVQRELVLRGQPSHSRGQYGEPRREPVQVLLRVKNEKASGLGRALPAGTWQVYKQDGRGRRLFLGESRFGHSAAGGEVVLGIGNSFDVTAERVQTDYRKLSNVRWDVETAYRITLRNASGRDEVVRVREELNGQWELRGASFEHRRADASTLGFDVPVAAGEEAVLEYRVAIDW